MLQSFLTLPSWQIVLICVAIPVVIVIPVVKIILGKRIDTQGDDATVLSPLVGFIGTAFTLLLAFVIVNVWSDQVAKQDVLFAEVTTIENIIIESRIIDPITAPAIKAKILEYMDSMVENEIDVRPPVGGDASTERKFEEVLTLIDEEERKLEADPTKQAEAQSFFEETREWITDREMRVNKTAAELDDTFTGILLMLALLTILSVALLPATSAAWAKWVQSIGVAAAVGLVMSLVFYIASDSFTREAEEQQVTRVEEALGEVDLNVL
jgi:hypothetical protein